MAGYDPFVELFEGTPVLSDNVAVTTEGVFPLLTGAVALVGQIEAAAEIFGALTVSGLAELVGSIEAAVEVNGSTLTVTADQFVGWGIPMGV